MAQRPTLETERLVLRPFGPADAAAVAALCADRDIAATTRLIPHPYELAHAQEWIGRHQESFDAGTNADFAVTTRDGGTLAGAVGLRLEAAHDRAELGYWIGKPWWGRGFATEAAAAALRYAFEGRGVARVYACHFGRNAASGRVLRKIGMVCEGCSRRHLKKWGVPEDIVHYALLREEYERARAKARRRVAP